MGSETEMKRMPTLFIGHGNPMFGIQENEFTDGWRDAVRDVPKPAAIVVVSAHWETAGSKVTAMAKPRIIHDFYGFPQELFDAGYDAVGSPVLAEEIAAASDGEIEWDESWGLDHGSWTILRKMYPEADIPVLQISLDVRKNPRQHYDLGKRLAWLRERGVLIIGSGNVVHNLAFADFRDGKPADWALSADAKLRQLISARETEKLMEYGSLGEDVRLGVPTPEHYLPLLYPLAAAAEEDEAVIFNQKIDLSSVSMTSVKWG